VRLNGHWEKRTWFETIDIMAERLGDVVRRYGHDSVGILGSARGTNEENYLAQKFARVVLGTNNIDCCARVCHAPTATAMSDMLGTGAATNSYADIEEAKGFLICGANATENHPIIGNRIKQAVLRGASLVVIDPREIELARYADVHLTPRPGTNILLLNAIAAAIVEENLCNSAWMERRVEGFTEFRKFIKNFAPEIVDFSCGVSARLIREAARVYAQSKPAMCFHGLGVTEHKQGVDGVKCLVNLALLTGNIGRVGSGVNPLRGQNNVQGAAHMGCDPRHLTGYAEIEAGRATFESAWGAILPKQRGMDLVEMIGAAEAGQLKALWVIGYDIALTNADANRTAKALRNLEFLAVQDLFLNRTASEFASVFLPAASPFERDGTFMNSERRVQRIRRALPPPPYARADWQIICDVAKAMGTGEQFAFNGPQDIWDEIRSVWPTGRGITYERLERAGPQWPCPDESHPGTRVLHDESFAGRPKAQLARIQFYPSREIATPSFPYILTTGRTLAQFNAGTMTMRTLNTSLRPTDTLDMSPDDAEQLGLSDRDIVRVASHHGATTLPLRIDPRLRAGELFATFHTTSADLNRVTGSGIDEHSHTPEYKVTAVDVQKVCASDAAPGRYYEPNS
jgi:formate dehydrogenase major subunit